MWWPTAYLSEYKVPCTYDAINVATARWVSCDDAKRFSEFKEKCRDYLAMDNAGCLTYIAPTRVNLNLAEERWPEVIFTATKEI